MMLAEHELQHMTECSVRLLGHQPKQTVRGRRTSACWIVMYEKRFNSNVPLTSVGISTRDHRGRRWQSIRSCTATELNRIIIVQLVSQDTAIRSARLQEPTSVIITKGT